MLRAVLVAVVLASTGGPRAHAQDATAPVDGSDDAEARARFRSGSQHFDAGEYAEAVVEFEAAYRLSPRPALLYNLYIAEERLGHTEQAVDYLHRYLTEGEPGDRRAPLETRLANLRERLQQERIEAARRADRERALAEAARDNDPGAAPWIVTGAGALLSAGGVVLVLLALSDVDTVEHPEGPAPQWSSSKDAYDRAPVLSTVGAIGIGVGAAAIGVGLIWALTSGAGSSEVELGVGPGSLGMRGRF